MGIASTFKHLRVTALLALFLYTLAPSSLALAKGLEGFKGFEDLFDSTETLPPNAAKPELVELTSLTDVDHFQSSVLKKAPLKNLEKVRIFHVGEYKPELHSLLRWLKRNNIPFEFERVSTAEFNKQADEAEKMDAQSAQHFDSELYKKIVYQKTVGIDHSYSLPFNPVSGALHKSWVKMRSFWGMAGAMSWAIFVVKHDKKQMLAEGGFATAKTIFTSAVLYTSLKHMEAQGHEVSYFLPIVLNIASTFIFDYMQRGNLALKTQGADFNYETKKFETNRLFYSFHSYLHSFVIRQAGFMLAGLSFHKATGFAFLMGMADFWRIAHTSAKGLVAKLPIDFFIKRLDEKKKEREGEKYSEWAKMGWLAASSTLLASMQIMDTYEFGHYMRTGLTYMGYAGLAYELYLSRRYVINPAKKSAELFSQIISRESIEPEFCQTMLFPVYKQATAEVTPQ